METGGMKGRRKELTRQELHATLCAAAGVRHIHSEYGMTELLSQAYAYSEGNFLCPPWMRIRIRELNDPFDFTAMGRNGAICVTDLANYHSCAFIATQDLGRLVDADHVSGEHSILHAGNKADHSSAGICRFQVLGRYDYAEARGCNLMLQ